MIEIRHLRYFVAVAEEMHFGRAAERLHMAQSPLSQQIRQLEQRLGVILLERDHHVVGLTDAGRTLLGEARSILERVDAAVERTRRSGLGQVGFLGVGYVAEMTVGLLPRSLRAHLDTHPDVAVDLSPGPTGDLLSQLRNRRLDLAFVRSPGPADGLEYEALHAEPLCLAIPAGHHLAGRAVRLTDLSDADLVVPSFRSAPGLRIDVDAACRRVGATPRRLKEASSPVAAVMTVAAGVGVALVPRSTVDHLALPGISCCPLGDRPTTTDGVCWRSAETSEVVLDFLDTVRAVARPAG